MEIEALYVYPIKSVRGIKLETAIFTPTGIKHDRTFMLLKDCKSPANNPKDPTSRYQNMHVSHFPSLCLFSSSYPPNSNPLNPDSVTATHYDPKSNSHDSITIPLRPEIDDLERISVTMHQSRTEGYIMPKHYSAWFTSHFGFDVILAYLGNSNRTVLGNVAPNARQRNPQLSAKRNADLNGSWVASISRNVKDYLSRTDTLKDEDYKITFADCAPYMVVNRTSVSEVDTRLEKGDTADVTKFRPNIVVSGAKEAWEEDFWAGLAIAPANGAAEVFLSFTANCVRCPSLNVDYETGAFGKQELLKKLQKDRRLDKGMPYSPCFGRYGFMKERDGKRMVSVGDKVRVSERNQELTVTKWPGLGITKKEEWYPV